MNLTLISILYFALGFIPFGAFSIEIETVPKWGAFTSTQAKTSDQQFTEDYKDWRKILDRWKEAIRNYGFNGVVLKEIADNYLKIYSATQSQEYYEKMALLVKNLKAEKRKMAKSGKKGRKWADLLNDEINMALGMEEEILSEGGIEERPKKILEVMEKAEKLMDILKKMAKKTSNLEKLKEEGGGNIDKAIQNLRQLKRALELRLNKWRDQYANLNEMMLIGMLKEDQGNGQRLFKKAMKLQEQLRRNEKRGRKEESIDKLKEEDKKAEGKLIEFLFDLFMDWDCRENAMKRAAKYGKILNRKKPNLNEKSEANAKIAETDEFFSICKNWESKAKWLFNYFNMVHHLEDKMTPKGLELKLISDDLMPLVVVKPSPFKRFLVQVAGKETFVNVVDAFGMMRILLESHLTIRKFLEIPRHRNADMEKKITEEDSNVVALSQRLDGWRNVYSHMKKVPKWRPFIKPKEIMVYEERIYIQCREDFQKIALDFVESWKRAVLKTSIFVGMALAKTVPEVPIKYIGKGEYKDDLKKKEDLVKKWKELEKDLNKCVKDASKTLRKRNLEESRKQITEKKGKLCKEELENVKGVIQGIKGDMAKVPLEALKAEYKVEKLGEIWRKYISCEKEERRGRVQEEERKQSKNGRNLEGGAIGENGQQKDGHCGPSPAAAEQSQRGIWDILDDEEKRKEKEEEEEEEEENGGGTRNEQENPHNERGRYLEKDESESGGESEGGNASSTSSSREEPPSAAEEIPTGKKRDVTFTSIFPNNDQLTRGYSL